MINIYMYFNLMFYVFLLLFMLSGGMFYMDYGVMLEWSMVMLNSMNIEFIVLLDWISLLFISFIFLISSMIMLYSYMYMYNEEFIERFIYLVILFIFSMVLMIISPNIISILFGWDGLGLVSYCLVIFYQNYLSYNSGMVTVLSNRIGDVGVLMGISLLMIKGSWNFWSFDNGKLIMMMMFLAAITKSAQIPFSSWLPMAMAAPTPVSALVHSSTLVTAGVYLMIRFNKFLMGSGINLLLFFIAVVTMFMSGFMANVENDLKKIIALSTLSQLGLMMMILSLGLKMVAFYHLLTHAIFKSMLFMCAGVMIHSMMNNQDIRLFGNLNEIIPFTMMSFFIASMALSGFPFMAGFYSKDLIMELIYEMNINICLLGLILFSLVFTVSYSIRLFYYMYFNFMKFYSFYNFNENSLMNMSMMILVMMSIFVGAGLNWMFFFDYYLIFLALEVKMLTLSLCVLGGGLGAWFSLSNCIYKSCCLIYYLSSMWFLNYLGIWIYEPFNLFGGEMHELDKTWVEFSKKKMVTYLSKIFNKLFYFKVYMFMFIFTYVFLLIFIML